MNLHEYQAKILFRRYGLPTSVGEVAFSAMLAESIPVDALGLQNGIYRVRITPDNSAPVIRALAVQR